MTSTTMISGIVKSYNNYHVSSYYYKFLSRSCAISILLSFLALFYTALILREYHVTQVVSVSLNQNRFLIEQAFNGTADYSATQSSLSPVEETKGQKITTPDSLALDTMLQTPNPNPELDNVVNEVGGLDVSTNSTDVKYLCEPDYVKLDGKIMCRPTCARGFFYLAGMTECHKWLTCSDMRKDVMLGPHVGGGNVKKLYLGRWKGQDIIVNRGNPQLLKSYFLPGLRNILEFQPSPYIIQYIGHCRNFLLTEYHPLGDLSSIHETFAQEFPMLDNPIMRFRLCLDYVNILSYLTDPLVHHGRSYIMCDTSALKKLASQYLVTTSFRLVLNDVDSLPFIDYANSRNSTRCGRKPKIGLFSAPETRWPKGMSYHKSFKVYYNEKVDVWKVPDVCNYILGTRGSSDFKILLWDRIHVYCKAKDPMQRPTANHILAVYKEIYESLIQDERLKKSLVKNK